MTNLKFLSFLQSRPWCLSREVVDVATNTSWRALGLMCFSPWKDCWLATETGVLSNPHSIFPFSRQYVYELDGSEIIVRFQDGRWFHTIDCQSFPNVDFVHHCGNDLYKGSVAISESSWEQKWQITGPKKNLRIRTYFS